MTEHGTLKTFASISTLAGSPLASSKPALGLFAATFIVLGIDPLLWLVRSWSAPGYDSPGAVIFAGVVLLFVWSASSPLAKATRMPSHRFGRALPVVLLTSSLVLRLLSQILAINLVGALLLAVDVFAMGLLLRVRERERRLAPAFLAALFCFALPLEPLLQRSLGFVLQQWSAASACAVLGMFYADLSCDGVRIVADGVDVLVDLPCSGARVLLLLLTAFFALGAVKPLSPLRAIAGFCFTVLLALGANTWRILMLAVGLRHEASTGINVMLDPWHSGIGLTVAAVSGLTLLLWMHFQPSQLSPVASAQEIGAHRLSPPSGVFAASRGAGQTRFALSLMGFVVAVAVVSLSPRPIDVSEPLSAPQLPVSLNGFPRRPLPLSVQETEYFAAFGGAAARAGYGDSSLLVVRTTSPLRHLHTPDVCFAAAGHEVDYVGADFSSGAEAIYHSRSPGGDSLRIGVRFISESGRSVHSIGEVVWHWFARPSERWTMVQTVTYRNAGHRFSQDAENFIAAAERSLSY